MSGPNLDPGSEVALNAKTTSDPGSEVVVNAGSLELPLPDAPYRGIEPFRFIDQQIFAARTDETWALLSNVTLYRAVILYGDSGTGKSSLINAGLLPKALKENFIADRLRVQPFAGREIKIERIRESDGAQATYLPSSFGVAEPEISLEAFRKRIYKFRPFTYEDKVPFKKTSEVRPLLIFDQFEEFITLFEEAQRLDAQQNSGGASSVLETQQNILTMLVELIQDQALPIKIIFSFREDYLAKLSLLFNHCPELLDQSQRLLPPHVDTLAEIIRAPFLNSEWLEHYQQLAGANSSELSEDLAERIAAQLKQRSEGERANLTELQIVCQRLWEAPDPEKLFAKGIEKILEGYGVAVFQDFTPELRDVAVILLSLMVTASNTRNIVSEGDLFGRTTDCNFSEPECGKALAALARSQIVRREVRRDIAFYEITSEYLVPWIKELVAERKAAEEQRAAAVAQKKLELEREAAVAKFEAEQRRALVFKRVVAALGVVLSIAIGLGIFVLVYYQKAKAERHVKERVLTALSLISSQDDKERLEGMTQVDGLYKEGYFPPRLMFILLASVRDDLHSKVGNEAVKILLAAAKNDPTLRDAVLPQVETDSALVQQFSSDTATNLQDLSASLPPRIYIHISDESQRKVAQQLADTLVATKRYLVPGIQNVGNKAPSANELRYFQKSDPAVNDIRTILEQATSYKWADIYTPGYENSEKIRAGHFEVWFAGGSWLRAFPVDEQGNYIPNLRMTYVITDSKGKSITKNTTYVPLAPGDYELQATFEGYEPVKTRVKIERGQETQMQLFVKKTGKKPDK